ncbi:MAG: MarR family winged helix-turn-helix transcriptional regulator [Thermoplasmata archaeon]
MIGASTLKQPDPFEGGAIGRIKGTLASLNLEIRKTLQPHGLLTSDARAMRLCMAGPTRPSTIAQGLDISPAAVTQLLDRLEERHLILRTPDPEDRRATVVSLTSQGTRLYRTVVSEIRSLLDELARELGPEGLAAVQRGADALDRALAQWRRRPARSREG